MVWVNARKQEYRSCESQSRPMVPSTYVHYQITGSANSVMISSVLGRKRAILSLHHCGRTVSDFSISNRCYAFSVQTTAPQRFSSLDISLRPTLLPEVCTSRPRTSLLLLLCREAGVVSQREIRLMPREQVRAGQGLQHRTRFRSGWITRQKGSRCSPYSRGIRPGHQ